MTAIDYTYFMGRGRMKMPVSSSATFRTTKFRSSRRAMIFFLIFYFDN